MLAEPSVPASVEQTVTLQTPVESVEARTPESPAKDNGSALDRAVKSGDPGEYRRLRHQQRVDALEGKTTPPAEKPIQQAKPEQVAPQPKKKSLDGRRQAVDAEVEDLKRQIAVRKQLQQELQAFDLKPKAQEPPKDAAQPKRPTYADDPSAPKLEQFESYEAYLDARADFIADKKLEARLQERDQQTSRQSAVQQKVQGVESRGQAFAQRVTAYQKTNPTIQFSPELMNIMPQSAVEAHNALAPPEQQIPLGAEHFVMEQIFDSEKSGELLAHFTQHPDAFERLYTLAHQNPAAVVRQIGALEGSLTASPAPSPSARVSSLPTPPTVLNGGKVAHLDPLSAAVKSGDARLYRQLRHQQRVAALGR